LVNPTSVPRTKSLGKKIVANYRLRMQIEEEFIDIKSSLFGLGFEHHKSRYVHRIAVLILIATLASILANIIGLAIFMDGLHRRYQANTVKIRRVLSFHLTIWHTLLHLPRSHTSLGGHLMGHISVFSNHPYAY
jgi:hypothetical protein